MSYFWGDGSIELEFAVDEPVGVFCANFVYAVVVILKFGIVGSAGMVSGIGKKGDFGLFAIVFNESVSGIFNNGV